MKRGIMRFMTEGHTAQRGRAVPRSRCRFMTDARPPIPFFQLYKINSQWLMSHQPHILIPLAIVLHHTLPLKYLQPIHSNPRLASSHPPHTTPHSSRLLQHVKDRRARPCTISSPRWTCTRRRPNPRRLLRSHVPLRHPRVRRPPLGQDGAGPRSIYARS
jgi:hypothetical protein